MRKLAYFSFAFAAGCAVGLLDGIPKVLQYCVAALCACFVLAGFVFRGRKERAVAIIACGLLLGLARAALSQQLVYARAVQQTAKDCEADVMLCTYPEETAYGYRAEGLLQTPQGKFRTLLYFDDDAAATQKPGDWLHGVATVALKKEKYGLQSRADGVFLRCSFHEIQLVEAADHIPLRYLPCALAKSVQETVERIFPEDVRGYFLALLTADKRGLTQQQRSDFQIAGNYHALAVSGMHVSILMAALYALTFRRQRLYPILGIPVLALYCLTMGMAPSVVRAAVMHLCLMLGPVFRREPDAPTGMGLSLLLLSAQNPWCLFQTGLQLSFLATAGLLAFQRPICRALSAKPPKKLRRLYFTVAQSAAQTLSALILTAPFMAYQFGILSVFSVLSNLLTLQAITVSFCAGILAVLFSLVLPWLCTAAAFLATWTMRYVAWVTGKIAAIPIAGLYPRTPYLWIGLLFVYLVLLLLWILRPKLRAPQRVLVACCVTLTVSAGILLSWMDQDAAEFSFSALDVGQGQCLLYLSQGQSAAVDCGSQETASAGETLARQLLSDGRSRLDLLILTHYDADHTNGVQQLLHRIPVGRIFMPDVAKESAARREIEQAAQQAGTEIVYVTEDLLLPFGAGTLRLFAPVSDLEGNDAGLSVLASFSGYDILATGDMDEATEKALLRTGEIPDLELLVAGHHGSKTSTGSVLLEVTKPEAVIISVGENSYGHPASETLARIAAVGADVYRTDQNGTVTVRR